MRKLLWIGNGYFCQRLPELGWRLVEHDASGARLFSWDELCQLADGPPEVLVLADKSLPPLFLGLEDYPCLTVFYCVDSHIHGWHPTYGQAFDLCLVSLKDHLPRFAGQRLAADRLLWSPAFAPALQPDLPAPAPNPKDWDLLFVGNVNPQIMPGRVAFLDRLKHAFPGLEVRQGDYRTLFPRSRLVLNYAERGDLNFRVFQALSCGACLLTPAIGHGQDELFEPGRDLFTYDPDDFDGLLVRIRACLADPERCAAVAASGLAKVDAGHRATHRAAAFDAFLRRQPATELISARRAQAPAIHESYLRLLYLHFAETLDAPELKHRFLQAARRR